MQQAYEGMAARCENALRSNNPSVSHAAYNHLVATHSPPGGGKSTYLDKLLERVPADLKSCPGPVTAVLKDSVPLAVTYNARTPYSAGVLDDDPESGLCCRMLFR